MGFSIQFPSSDAQQIPLQQAVGKQYEDDLIDDQAEGA